MPIPLGVIFGVVAMLGWGAADFLVAKAVRKTSVFKTFLWSQIVGVALLFMAFAMFFEFPAISAASAAVVLAAGLLGTAGHLAFYKGLQVGKVSIISPVASCWAVVTVILSLVFLNESLAALQLFGISLAILGAVFSSFRAQDLIKLKLRNLSKGAGYAALASLSWGVYFVLIGFLVPEMGWFLPIFFIKGAGLLYLAAYSGASRQDVSFPKSAAVFVAVIGILEAAAFLAYGLGVTSEYTAIVAPVTATFPAVTVILAKLFFKERLDTNQKLGIVSVMSGIILLSL